MRRRILGNLARTLAVFNVITLCLGFWPAVTPDRTAKASSQNVTVYAAKDKFVDDIDGAYDNWPVPSSSTREIYVGQFYSLGYGNEQAVIGFTLPQIDGSISSVSLVLDIGYVSGGPHINLYGSYNDDGWTETDMTVPAKDVTILTNEAVGVNHSRSFNVTNFVVSQYGGDKKVTFVLSPSDTSYENYLYFLASEDPSNPPKLVVTCSVPSATISSGSSLTESNIDGSTVTLTLEDTTFADSSLSAANFTLTGTTSGLSITGVHYTDSTHCTLTLDHDGRDFDSNLSFSLLVNQSETTGGTNITTNSLTVTATNDPESISLADDGLISEGAENGEIITVTLSGGIFCATLTPANWTVGNLPAGVSKGAVTRTGDHTVTIALSGNASADYDSDITNVSVSCTADEYGDSAGGGSLTGTGITLTATNDAESLGIAGDGLITEGAENGEIITVTLTGGEFASTITPANWTVGNLPAGVSKGAVTRTGDHTVTIALSGNASADYDSDITNVSVSCTADEYGDSAGGGALSATGITLTATNDAESLGIDGDGLITEGAENGEIITVTLTGGEFASTITPANWTVGNLPAGVSKGAVTRTGDHTVTIALSGNASADYDSNITNVSVSCTADEYGDSAGGGALSATGITLTATNDAESLGIADDGLITEGAENGEIITVTLTGGIFAASLTPANWTVSNLPAGVTKGDITRVDGHTVTIALSGNALWDYDTDIGNVSVSCTVGEYTDSQGGGALSATGIVLTATNDAESISIADDGLITEGAENGEVITVSLQNGHFTDPIDDAQWSVNNLPQGVTAGSVTLVDSQTVRITLSGNTARDYDVDITGICVTCTSTQYVDSTHEGPLAAATGVTLTAVNDAESITAANDGLITEGSENGEIITVTLTGGTFTSSLTPANWTVAGLPAGVSKGTVSRVDDHTVTLTLSGNASADYDSDKTVSVTCTADEYDDNTGGGSLSSSVVFTAVNDAESIAAATDGLIAEGSEDGEIITVTLSGGTFTSSLTPANWTLGNLPSGVSKGTVTRVDEHTATIALSGNASADYDSDQTVTVTCTADEYDDNTGGGSLSSSVIFTAVNDAESIAAATDGFIAEGSEDGEIITVTLTGGTFTSSLTPANWTVAGLPAGVSKGTVSRVDDHTVTLTLWGNASADYDSDKTVSVTCTADEYDDNTGGGSLSSSVDFTAVNDAESIAAATDGLIAEGSEDSEIITVTLSGGTFASSLTPANWTVGNLPAGVSKGTVTRVNDHTATIALSGSATADYDSDRTISITCTAGEYDDSADGGSLSSSVVITAVNDAESIAAATDGLIAEGSEDGEIITVTLSGGTFTYSLTPANWTVGNLPAGVSKGTVTRVGDHTVTIALSGSATADYDSDKTVSVTCTAAEYGDSAGGGSLSSSVVITAVKDAEAITAATDGLIAEGAEDGEVITVTLSGGQFADALTLSHWTAQGLPEGVTLGSVTRTGSRTARITLSGDARWDYDADLAVYIRCTTDEYGDSAGGSGLTAPAIVLKAQNDAEILTLDDDGLITEGAENGEVITVTLTGGQFAAALTSAHWTVANLPAGVAKGTVTRVDDHTVRIRLSGNTAVDYDADITNVTVSCTADEYGSSQDTLTASGGVTLRAVVEVQPTPSPTPSPLPTPTPSPTPSPSPSSSAAATATAANTSPPSPTRGSATSAPSGTASPGSTAPPAGTSSPVTPTPAPSVSGDGNLQTQTQDVAVTGTAQSGYTVMLPSRQSPGATVQYVPDTDKGITLITIGDQQIPMDQVGAFTIPVNETGTVEVVAYNASGQVVERFSIQVESAGSPAFRWWWILAGAAALAMVTMLILLFTSRLRTGKAR